MKIFWWQGGIHIEPETKDEAKILKIVYTSMEFSKYFGSFTIGDDEDFVPCKIQERELKRETCL